MGLTIKNNVYGYKTFNLTLKLLIICPLHFIKNKHKVYHLLKGFPIDQIVIEN